MPRGVRRSEVEILQAEIAAAEKKREKILQEADTAKKNLTKLQHAMEQQYAREIAKACRAANISLQEVLNWVKSRQTETVGTEKPKTTVAEPAKKQPAAKKAPPATARTKKTVATSARAKKKVAAKTGAAGTDEKAPGAEVAGGEE